MAYQTLARVLALLLVAAQALGGAAASAQADDRLAAAQRLIVSPSGPFTTIEGALAAARPGDTVEVRGGTYAGPLTVATENLTLEGVDWPVIDGGGQGTVVTLAAAGVVFRGFEVHGSGVEPDQDHGGITLTAPRIVVENNRLRDVLFGIFVAQADDSVVRGNDVSSKLELDPARKGDAIRIWYSQGVRVEDNDVHQARDLVAWYSSDLVLRANRVVDGRYGIHLMYCDDTVIESNTFEGNSVGIFTMYSENVVLRGNLLRGQRGPSGYALGFKDADNITVSGNVLVDNRAGLFMDGTPFTPQGYGRIEDNLIAFNDVGAIVQPAVHGNVLAGNTFWENVEQVAVQGGGRLGENAWDGNYWSDYGGFDADGDGRGDVPYRAERFFEGLMDNEPRLRALLYSPAVDALEMAAGAFPVVRPQPKFADASPLTEPGAVPAWAAQRAEPPAPLAASALALLGLSLLVAAAAWRPQGDVTMKAKPIPASEPASADRRATGPAGGLAPRGAAPTLRAAQVSKRYGRVQALAGVSLEAGAGEALALWGANGAGKSTLLKAMLGLLAFEGQITVAGHDVRRAGKLARRHLGYVPQDVIFYDQSVQATMAFYARLKSVSPERIPLLLDRLGLTRHAHKPVPALSGGLRQRLALAVALLAEPAVLLLDEPTANLDAQAQSDYLSLLAALRRDEGKTIVFASHRLEEVQALANRVLVLEQGRLAATLTPVELLARLMPEIELALWVPEAQRSAALDCLAGAGWPAHFNGRGTVVVRVRAEHKARPLQALHARGITVQDFELLRGGPWN